MCHNKEVSLVIFIFALAVVTNMSLEYKKTKEINYAFVAMYIMLLSLMQFVEFFIHLSQELRNNFMLKIASWAVLLTFISQFIGMEVYLHSELSGKKILPDETFVLDAVFFCSVIMLVYGMNKNNFKNKKVCNDILGCKLQWDVMDRMGEYCKPIYMLMFLIYLVYTCLITYYLFDTPVFALYIVLTGIILFCGFSESFGKLGTGSAWCLYVVFLMILMVALGGTEMIK